MRPGRTRSPQGRLPATGALATALASALALWAGAAAAGTSGATPAAQTDEGAYDPFSAFDPPDPAEPAEVYRDRILSADALPPLPEDDAAADDGPRRDLHVEAVAHRARFAGADVREVGLGVGGSWDSADHGTFSLDALAFRSERDRVDGSEARWRGSATLWQRGLDLRGGWRVDNGLGVLATPMPATLRDQYRFLLPAVPLLGASTEWRRRDRGLVLQASVGRGGVYDGARLSGFETGDGQVASLGAEWRESAQWRGAAELLLTDGRIVPRDHGVPAFQNGATRALLLGQRWQGARDGVGLQVLGSDADGTRAAGAWLDARSVRGAYEHRYGAFRLAPDLAWGAWPIANDAVGGYYRVDFRRARWSWNLGLDRVGSVSGDGFDGWYGTGYLRYQASPRLGYGGGIASRRGRGDGDADTAQGFLDWRNAWGDTRLQADLARADEGRSWRLQADHALRLREGWRLSLSAATGRVANGGIRPARTVSFAAYGGFDLGDDFAIDGTARWTRSDGDASARGLDLGLGWRWRLSSRWTLLGTLDAATGSRRSPFVLDPLSAQPADERLPNDRSATLRLRYETAAGRARSVIGGAPGAATGRVAGSVFLDDNADGVRSASEQPAADVVLVLDGRYVVRTDAQGRFAFDRVAVGTHTLDVQVDNLPLPWTLDAALARRSVRVEVREDTRVDIGAVRPR